MEDSSIALPSPKSIGHDTAEFNEGLKQEEQLRKQKLRKIVRANRKALIFAGQSPIALKVKKEKVLDRKRRSIEVMERDAAYGSILTQKMNVM